MSPRAAARLAEIGYRNVVEYPGGLTEWRQVYGRLEAGLPSEPTQHV